ncbi:MAG: hypothetical protein IJS08_14285, partial [Victivallales bacterium]|nr:hypothetical protein [Victivallales bacterium]
MDNFEKWDREFRAQNLFAFNGDMNALLWLKVRAVCRGKQLELFLHDNNIRLISTKISEQNVELFKLLETRPDALDILDAFLKVENHNLYASMGIDEARLKEDLYRIQHYAWGGDQNNSLDKYLISRYVKVISKYDDLIAKQAEIADNSWNYVQTSWYNNWTSYLIEALFKRHPKVVSAVGEIKSVDFFVNNVPIDLKVTYFPSQYMEMRLKDKLGCSEIVWLKKAAKQHGIVFDPNLNGSQLTYVLTEKLVEYSLESIVSELRQIKKDIILNAQNAPMKLMEWLYANQGEMR